MRYAILALTAALTVLSALPAKAGKVWIDDNPYPRRDRVEVVVRRCYGNDWRYNSPYWNDVYGCRYKVIRRYPYRRYHRVYRPFRDPYGIYYPNRYRHHRRGTVQIRIGY